MRKIKLTSQAIADLDQIWLYIAKDSPIEIIRILHGSRNIEIN